MTIASEIIRRAFRQDNITTIGALPTTDEAAEGLELLNDLINQLLGFELGELTYDWQVPPDARTSTIRKENPDDPYDERQATSVFTNPPSNVRIVAKITADTTLFLPEFPSNGARFTLADAGSTATALTFDANGRTVEGGPTLVVDPVTVTERGWFYRADLADWVRVTQLASGDESPFPLLFDMMLITGLSTWLSPRNGKEPRAVTQRIFDSMIGKFQATYEQEIPTPATYNLSTIMSFRRVRSSNREFVNG